MASLLCGFAFVLSCVVSVVPSEARARLGEASVDPAAPRDPAAVQAAQYDFPYHHLPHARDGQWCIERHLHWGFEYLSLLENVAHAIVALKPRSVLDFGCGDGRLLKELLVRLPDDVRLVGQDLDRRALMYARAFHDGTSVRFVPSLDDVAGERFDVIVTSEVLEHIPPDECRGVVEKLWERVAPSGSLVVTVPTTNLPLSRKHYRHFDLELLRAVVEPGFELRSVRYLHRAGAIHKLVRGLASNRLFLATWRPYLRGLQYAFRRWVEPAAASDGTRLLTVWARAQAQDWD